MIIPTLTHTTRSPERHARPLTVCLARITVRLAIASAHWRIIRRAQLRFGRTRSHVRREGLGIAVAGG